LPLHPQWHQKLAQDFGTGMTRPLIALNRVVAGLCRTGTGQSPVTTPDSFTQMKKGGE